MLWNTSPTRSGQMRKTHYKKTTSGTKFLKAQEIYEKCNHAVHSIPKTIRHLAKLHHGDHNLQVASIDARIRHEINKKLTCFRDEITTDAPSKPRRSAMPKPIPCVEAVITATLPSSLRGVAPILLAPYSRPKLPSPTTDSVTLQLPVSQTLRRIRQVVAHRRIQSMSLSMHRSMLGEPASRDGGYGVGVTPIEENRVPYQLFLHPLYTHTPSSILFICGTTKLDMGSWGPRYFCPHKLTIIPNPLKPSLPIAFQHSNAEPIPVSVQCEKIWHISIV